MLHSVACLLQLIMGQAEPNKFWRTPGLRINGPGLEYWARAAVYNRHRQHTINIINAVNFYDSLQE